MARAARRATFEWRSGGLLRAPGDSQFRTTTLGRPREFGAVSGGLACDITSVPQPPENSMNKLSSFISRFVALSLALALLSPVAALAADKAYQVTGPVLEVSDTSITVQKGTEKWTLARDKDTKVTGELKAGAKVTIGYRMTANTVEVKGDAKAAKAAPDAKAAKPAKK
jgi:hypothetical protein